jgi:hypothetical protein
VGVEKRGNAKLIDVIKVWVWVWVWVWVHVNVF